ncbi:Ig-like domain-containing protein, partial [Planctomycetota bacterium]|nr:Ig-like domain-containing protein [Planctomycetota bacterium]
MGWASGIDEGGASDEDSQTLTFTVTNTNNGLFTSQPDVDEASGDLTYTLAADANGAATVSVTLDDGVGGSAGPATFNITVTAVNDAPVVVFSTTALSYTENDSATVIDSGATVTDIDSADFSGGSLTITGSGLAEDDLSIDTSGDLNLSAGMAATSILDELGTPFGTIMTDGQNGADLAINFNGASTLARVQLLLQAIMYANSSEFPDETPRQFAVVIDDGDIIDSTSTSVDALVDVTEVNDIPTLSAMPGSALTYTENQALTLAPGAVFGDLDGQNYEFSVSPTQNPRLIISPVSGFSADDRIFVRSLTAGAVGFFVDTSVSPWEVQDRSNALAVIATIDDNNANNEDGVGGNDLVIRFTDCPVNRISSLIRNLQFNILSDGPTGTARVIDFDVVDNRGAALVTPEQVVVGPHPTNMIFHNDAPVFSDVPTSVIYTEDQVTSTLLAGSGPPASINDPDTADLIGGSFTIQGTGNGEDQLTILNGLRIRLVGAIVQYDVNFPGAPNWQNIGLRSALDNGVNGATLVVDFSGATIPVSSTVVTELLRSIQYSNTSQHPIPTNRVYSVLIDDDDPGLPLNNDASSTPETGFANFTVVVRPVNDAPSFTAPGTPDVTVAEDSGSYSAVYATVIVAGPPEEVSQALTFNTAVTSGSALFSVQPTVDPITGILAFTPAPDAFGTANISLDLVDNGGTSFGGVDTFNHTFSIIITSVNDDPSFSKGSNVAVLEDSSAYIQTVWATNIDVGPSNETPPDAPVFTVTNNNNALFATQPALSPSGTLSFVPAANASGSATVSVNLSDGISLSGIQTFTITVTGVNDAPTLTGMGTISGTEDVAPTRNHAHLSAIATALGDPDMTTPGFRIKSLVNGTLLVNGLSASFNTVIYLGDVFVWTPPTDTNGVVAAFSVVAFDGSLESATGPHMVNFNLAPVNDTPFFTAGSDVTVAEDSGSYGPIAWATGISKGAANESADTLAFTVSNNNSSLFSTGNEPAIAPNGTLTFATEPNANGSAIVSVFVTDTSANSPTSLASATLTFTLTVTPVNDAPTLSVFSPIAGAEDTTQVMDFSVLSGAATVNDIDGDSLNFEFRGLNSGQLLINGLAAYVGQFITPTSSVVWTPNANVNGLQSAINVRAHDGTVPSATQTVSVNLAPVNDVPVASADSYSMLEDTTLNEPAVSGLLFNDNDIENDTMTAAQVGGLPANATSLTVNSDGSFSLTPVLHFVGVITFQYAVSDAGLGNTVTVTVTVTRTNHAPTITTPANLTGTEDIAMSLNHAVLTAALNPQDLNGDTVNFRVTAVNSGTLLINSVAVVIGDLIDATTVVLWTPAADANGVVASISVEAFDGMLPSVAPESIGINLAPV